MRRTIRLPNAATMHTMDNYLRLNNFCFDNLNQEFVLKAQSNLVHAQPFVLAQLAAWGQEVRQAGGRITYDGPILPGIQYAIRLGLFDYLGIKTDHVMIEHEPAGRFIELTSIRTSKEMDAFLTNVVPLLHLPSREPREALNYCLSELVRNVLEHSGATNGAVACAQYYKKPQYVAIGVADCGRGVRNTLTRNYPSLAEADDADALAVALLPGTTGAVRGRLGATENAGAGLFFTKSIARTGRQHFGIISGGAYYRLNPSNKGPLQPKPLKDNHRLEKGTPFWRGTIVGLNVNVSRTTPFNEVLGQIRRIFPSGKAQKRDYSKKVRFE